MASVGEERVVDDGRTGYYKARIVAERSEGEAREVHVHFCGFKKSQDVWIGACDARILPAGSQVPKYDWGCSRGCVDEDDEQWEVLALTGKKRRRGGTVQYEVEWVPKDDVTQQLAPHLYDASADDHHTATPMSSFGRPPSAATPPPGEQDLHRAAPPQSSHRPDMSVWHTPPVHSVARPHTPAQPSQTSSLPGPSSAAPDLPTAEPPAASSGTWDQQAPTTVATATTSATDAAAMPRHLITTADALAALTATLALVWGSLPLPCHSALVQPPYGTAGRAYPITDAHTAARRGASARPRTLPVTPVPFPNAAPAASPFWRAARRRIRPKATRPSRCPSTWTDDGAALMREYRKEGCVERPLEYPSLRELCDASAAVERGAVLADVAARRRASE